MLTATLLHQRFFVLAALVLAVAQTVCAEVTQPRRVLWQKVPITIALNVGEERLVHFRGPISVGIPATLQSVLRTQTVNGTVYLMANVPFGSTRTLVREIDGGQTYLLDLIASTDSGPLGPVVVAVDEAIQDHVSFGETGNIDRYDYVSLTRFAAQQMYAPTRLLSAAPGIIRVPVQQQRVVLVPGGAIEAMALVSWRAGSLYVTAVKLTNRSTNPQVLDPRTLRGSWLSAAFQHSRLLPAGDEADTTAVYLVSAQPFVASL